MTGPAEIASGRVLPPLEAIDVAKSLTGKEAAAVRGIFRWDNVWEQEEGEAVLYALGIWNPRPKYRASILTPLGLEVKALLERTDDGTQ